MIKNNIENRFWAKVKKTSTCWIWAGSKSGTMGYGQFWHPKGQYAHRYSYELHKGIIPKGLFVTHRCDNPPCVRPDHLFLGTAKQNSTDMVKRGRSSHGVKNGQAKLTDKRILAILKIADLNVISHTAIGRAFFVDSETIRHIIQRKTWKHVNHVPRNNGTK